jgi:putative ABC transport system permease protein
MNEPKHPATVTRAFASPLTGRATSAGRWRAMGRVGIAMMFHDRLKLVGTLAGVFFAVVLADQQAGVFMGLIEKNVMFVSHAGADLWIVPPGTEQLQPGKPLADTALFAARATNDVAWAEPLLFGIASISLPSGGSSEVTLIGTKSPRFAGGPWNLVAGARDSLQLPDAVIFEDSVRDTLGDLNLGSVRELNGHRVRVAGFTWGLLPFSPPYAFAGATLARDLMHVPPGRESFVLIGVRPGADPLAVAARIQRQLPEVRVLTRDQFERSIVVFLLTKTALGVSLGASTLFGLLIGFVTVSLSMFSSVVDNIRQFGTLKALGATTSDLARLLCIQAVVFAGVGSIIGLAVLLQVASLLRSPSLAVYLPPVVVLATAILMVALCISAAMVSIFRLRQLEPGMVFR